MTHKNKTESFLLFLLAKYFWAWALPWSVLNTTSDTPLEKTVFFSISYQLQIDSWLGMRLCISFSFSVLGFLCGLKHPHMFTKCVS